MSSLEPLEPRERRIGRFHDENLSRTLFPEEQCRISAVRRRSSPQVTASGEPGWYRFCQYTQNTEKIQFYLKQNQMFWQKITSSAPKPESGEPDQDRFCHQDRQRISQPSFCFRKRTSPEPEPEVVLQWRNQSKVTWGVQFSHCFSDQCFWCPECWWRLGPGPDENVIRTDL